MMRVPGMALIRPGNAVVGWKCEETKRKRDQVHFLARRACPAFRIFGVHAVTMHAAGHGSHLTENISMNILHVGATGLVGKLVLARLLDEPRVTQVIAPTRRSLDIVHPKLLNLVVDFDALPKYAPWWAVDAVICTLGTTMKLAGSEAAFRRVDHDYPLQVAQLAHQHGARAYALNSAMGADVQSSVFYNRVKGELESALGQVGYRSLVLVRPGVIDGERSESRPGEAAALAVSRLLRPLLPRKWRPSRAPRIAQALIDAALDAPPGRHSVEAAELA